MKGRGDGNPQTERGWRGLRRWAVEGHEACAGAGGLAPGSGERSRGGLRVVVAEAFGDGGDGREDVGRVPVASLTSAVKLFHRC